MTATACRDAFAEAVRSFDLASRVAEALSRVPRPQGRAVIVAAGKSAASMLAGAVRWSQPVDTIVVSRPARSLPLSDSTRESLMRRGCALHAYATGHPLPDDASVQAAMRVRAALSGLGTEDLLLVLLSGGASAALCMPRKPLGLDDLRTATGILLARGTAIDEVNAVRGRLDSIKHGGLAAMAGSAPVVTFLASDVLGEPDAVLRAVGSAPTWHPVEAVISRELINALPPHIAAVAKSPRTRVGENVQTPVLVASPAMFRDAYAQSLGARGFAVSFLPDAVDDVETAATRYATRARTIEPGTAWVAIGEPTVRLSEQPGRGGRAGRLALSLVRPLASCARGTAFCAAASDGVDGEGGHAGAVVDDTTFARAEQLGLQPDRALATFDDAAFHEALGTAIDVSPTGLNLLDVHVIARHAD